MKRQQGFTLIELVVVIIILGILAVTAAPKFINLQGDARASTLQGLKGAVQGANSLIYSKAALAGKETGAQTVTLDSGSVSVINGYLRAQKAVLEAGMDIKFDTKATGTAAQSAEADWIIDATASTSSSAGTAKIYAHGAPDNCFFTYTEAKAAVVGTDGTITTPAELPKYDITATGC